MSADPPELLVTISHMAGCLTCADEAVVARVRSVDGLEAVVAVGEGEEVERVAIDLVPDAGVGDQLLCHAGIALERVEDDG